MDSIDQQYINSKSDIELEIGTKSLLKGKVALITGGGSGIGFAIAEVFLKAGCKCIISGRNSSKLFDAKNRLLKYGEDQVETMEIDILKVSEMKKNIEYSAKLFSDNRIDILVNNAAVRGTKGFLNVDEEEYDRVMDTNAKGTFFMTQAMGNYMRENDIKGHIINIGSAAALLPANTPYRMSKWAVKGLTLGAANVFLPYGIIVNAIAPGPTMTEMMNKKVDESVYDEKIPSKRFSRPNEIAALALYLVSGFADQIIGESININGGDGTLTLH